LPTRERLLGSAGLRRHVCDVGGVHRCNGTLGSAGVDSVLPGHASHVSALKEQPHGFAITVGGTRMFLDGSLEDRLTCNMGRRR